MRTINNHMRCKQCKHYKLELESTNWRGKEIDVLWCDNCNAIFQATKKDMAPFEKQRRLK